MALTKDKLIFDPADTADSDNLGAYLRAGSDGDLLSSTNVGGKEGLDVNIINTLGIDVDLDHAEDSVKVGDGTDFLAINSDGSIGVRLSDGTDSLAINADGSINSVVSATNLDIRDLVHTADSVKIGDGTDFLAVNADGSINSVVSATNLDIRDLTHASDSVKIGDGTDFANVTGDNYLQVFDAPNSSVDSTRVTVGATAVALPTTALSNRKRVMVQNISSNDVWIGPSDVTTSGATTGLKVSKGATLEIPAGAGVALYGIAAGAGNDVIVFEMA